MSIQLAKKKVEIDGVEYTLCCNMSVLERLQDGQDGDIGHLYQIPIYQAVFLILKAMLDDYCEDEGLIEVPMKRLKKLFSPAQIAEWGVFRMFADSMMVTTASSEKVSDPDTELPENSGN